MKREDLLRSKEYWINEIQNDLYGIIESYMEEKNITRTGLALELGVTKGYISQVLKGDFDHKISKMVDLSLAAGKAPMLKFIDLNKFIKDDMDGKQYEIYSLFKSDPMKWTEEKEFEPLYLNLFKDRKEVVYMSGTANTI